MSINLPPPPFSSYATTVIASMRDTSATMTTTAATAATRSTATRAREVAATARAATARAVTATALPVKEKSPRISADDVTSSDVPVDSVSGCIAIELYPVHIEEVKLKISFIDTTPVLKLT